MKAIETIDLTKYYGKFRGIENVNFSVNEGEILGFIGPNGAGKSTTIRLLLNFLYPTSGTAKIFGKDCFKESHKIKSLIGYVPGEVNYYEDVKVRDIFEYSITFYKGDKEKYRKKIIELAERFGLDLDRKISDLSLGNKKKVAVIQSLIHEPRLLIYDEPTNGLDPLVQAELFDLIREENKKGVTVFFSSHILSEVQKLCTKVVIIREGKIVAIEDIENLRKKHYKIIKVEGNIGKINLSGIKNLKIRDNRTSFLFTGDINELISFFSKKRIKDLLIVDPSLEEIFMNYYSKYYSKEGKIQ